MGAERPEQDIQEPRDCAQGAENGANAAQAGDAGEAAASPDTLLAEAQAKADEHWDRYVRAAAELENVRKRAARDVENAHRFALEQFGKELLAVRDSLEMGVAAAEGATVDSLLEGKAATLKLLETTMARFGIEQLDPLGEPFDPDFHEAISMQPSNALEPGSVMAVVQKGYTLNGRLLRPAMVIVAADQG